MKLIGTSTIFALVFGSAVSPWIGGVDADEVARVFHDLPKIVMAIRGPDGSAPIMTTRFAIELEPGEDKPSATWFVDVRKTMERRLLPYTLVSLQGSAGMNRLRYDMLDAARSVDQRIRVKELLIHELTVR